MHFRQNLHGGGERTQSPLKLNYLIGLHEQFRGLIEAQLDAKYFAVSENFADSEQIEIRKRIPM